MSYIVPGKFPTSCSGCHLFNLDDRDLWCIANHYAGYCRELSKYIDENKFVIEKHPDCPLIEVKTPHGRLIAEKTITEIRYHDADGYHIVNGEQLCELEIDAPTVIEAED